MFRNVLNIWNHISTVSYRVLEDLLNPFPIINPSDFTQHQSSLVKVYFAPGSHHVSGTGIEGDGSKLTLYQGGELAA